MKLFNKKFSILYINMKIHGGGDANLLLTLVVASCVPTFLLLSTFSYTILHSADAQRLPPSAEQERLIEESTPQPPSGEQQKLIEESNPSLIEEQVSREGFFMPVEDIRRILEFQERTPTEAAPLAIAGNNVYVVWWENKTGDWEVFFRASADNGKTFGDEINLSNDTTRSDDANVAAQGNFVYITWWNTNNQTGLREPFFIASEDNGTSFGEKIRLSGNESMQASGFEVAQ
jgi:hypothetical protein